MKLPRIIIVTGTDTGVGKTITTATLAAALLGPGDDASEDSVSRRVAVYKPCQTGAAIGDSDITEVARLAGAITAKAGMVLQEPLAPRAAAAVDGVTLPGIAEHTERILQLALEHDHVLVEGAGGILVDLDDEGRTLADLGIELHSADLQPVELSRGAADVCVVVVTRAALGTLNHTALTLEALRRRGLPILGIVVGSLPASPNQAEEGNLEVLAARDTPLLGAIPEGAALLPPTEFRRQATTWLPALGLQAQEVAA